MNQLQSFYTNQGQREAVKTFLIEVLKELTIEKAFEGKPVEGIKEANECIGKAFDRLEELYGKIEVEDIPNSR